MSKSHRQWLAGEIPELQSKGVLNSESIEKLSQYFGLDSLSLDEPSLDEPSLDKTTNEATGLSKMTITLAAVGGLLIGGGIIMLFAHNWDSIGRSQRMMLALLPLIVAQTFAFLALFPKSRGVAWREATAAFMFCAVPASIALVGQTYHISNDAQAFKTLWFVLILPFIYLLRAKLAAILAMALAVKMAIMYKDSYWLCVVALLPFYFFKEPYGRNTSSRKIGWLFALGLAIAIFTSAIDYGQNQKMALLVLMSGAVSAYLLGGLTEPKHGFWNRPFSNIGAVCIAMNLLLYTFKDFWRTTWFNKNALIHEFNSFEITLVLAAIIGLIWAYRTKRNDLLPLANLFIITCLFVGLPASIKNPILFSVMANIIALSLGVWYLWLGIKADSTSRMNFGLILIMAIILMRFFDQDFSFIVKGLAFIAMGSAFIGVNLWQNHRRKSV